MDHLNILQTALTQVSKDISMTKYPEIVFPQFVYVDSSADRLMDFRQHLTGDVTGDLDDGIIDINTTVFDQVDIKFGSRTTPLFPWLKTVSWTLHQLEKAAKFGVAIDTSKIKSLNLNAQQTLQKVAFIGHARKDGVKGLLNSPDVTIQEAKIKKAINTMTYDEATATFKDMFLAVFDQTNLIAAPDTIAISYDDYAYLAFLEKDHKEKTALQWLQEHLSGAAGKAVSIKPLPGGFAKLATAGSSKKRAIAYINDAEHVVFDVPQSPTILTAEKVGLVSFQSGLQMAFGGVTFKEPQSAIYVDY
ncbi:hypothetical protein V757_01075 [Pelistega indica]|uniref:DUF2184 domain-containing protein n=1 Tax=Pelistega indica TaxID=1414851 RepID=V8G997_9BURK|nr:MULTISPECIES: major capsid family protein [Pelistega]ETD72965.1 hypothetical protein V757_01075 [Pelistega indica]